MATQEQARDVRTKLQQLNACKIFGLGLEKDDYGYFVDIVLREPAPYGVPDSIDGVPLIARTLVEAAKQFSETDRNT